MAGGGIVRWLSRVSDAVMAEVGECVMYWIGKWWQRREVLLYAVNGWILALSLPPSMNS